MEGVRSSFEGLDQRPRWSEPRCLGSHFNDKLICLYAPPYSSNKKDAMPEEIQKITVRPNGPYLVRGNIPLVRKSEVISEHGEPLTWKKEGDLSNDQTYALCRCGQSNNKPFCDGSHTLKEFDGSEAADTGPISARQKTFDSPKIQIEDDHSICVHSGFCGNRITNIWKMRAQRLPLIGK